MVLARRRSAPFVFAACCVVAMSVVAYSGLVPPYVARYRIDKVLHAAMGFTLTFLLARALGGRALLAAVLVFVPVAVDEYFQRYSACRSSDWADLAADVVGIALAVALSRRIGCPRAFEAR
jgi:VanZ family protein